MTLVSPAHSAAEPRSDPSVADTPIQPAGTLAEAAEAGEARTAVSARSAQAVDRAAVARDRETR